MPIAKPKSWSMVSDTRRLQALDLAIMLTSSVFWTWLALSAVFPVLFFAQAGSAGAGFSYRLAVFATAAVVFLYAAANSDRCTRLLDSRKWEVALVVSASAGNAAAIVCCSLGLFAPAVASGIVEGATFPYFMLEWSRMYSRRGARTMTPLISGSLAIALLEAAIILALAPIMRAIVVAALPLLILLSLGVIHRLTEGGEEPESPSDQAFGAGRVLVQMAYEDDRHSALGKSSEKRAHRSFVLFVVAIAIVGFYFSSLELLGAPTAATATPLAAGFLAAAAAAFAVSAFAPRLIESYTKFVVLVGIAGLLFAAPLAGSGGTDAAGAVLHFSVGVCFTGSFIALCTVCAHLAYEGGVQCHAFSAPSSCALSIGFALATGLQQAAGLTSQAIVAHPIAVSAESFALVVAVLFFFVDGSYVWRNLENRLETEETEYNAAHGGRGVWDDAVERISGTYGLTERERDVLHYLLMGHSRASIADAMCLSTNTVSSHVQHIYAKMGIHSHQELLDYALDADGARKP